MEGSKCPPVIVEGDWTPAQTKALKNKLQIYFMSRKKSGGGDCRVEAEEGAPRAAVYFNSVEGESLLHGLIFYILISVWLLESFRNVNKSLLPSLLTDTFFDQVCVFLSDSESSQSCAVVLENVTDNMSTDLLSMLVENISGLDENGYSMERILESNKAVVTFSSPAGRKQTAGFVEKICIKKDLEIKSVTVKVYPYYKSLGTALYGKERPTWKMPEPFTQHVHHVIWKFLVEKKLSEHINDQMRPHFCRVDLNDPEVKLSPVPEFLRQQGLTAEHVENWMNKAQHAFHRLMSQYTAFICQTNAQGWRAAEKDVRSIVKEDAILVLDASQGVLTVAGRADRLKKIKAPVEKILLKAMGHIERQTNSISEEMILSPAMFYILKQEGLQKATLDISPEMKLSYDEGTQKLTIRGLPAEVYKTKSWISEKIMNMSKKHQNVPPCLLDFLRTLDPMDMSQDLFTSQGISAIYTIDNKSVLLFGSSDRALVDAESKMKAALAHQIVEVEDQKVLKLPTWGHLKQKLLDTYNLSKKKTVAIEMHPERRNKITVAGFVNPVKEVSHSLKEFIASNSQVQEILRLQSCAVVLFIKKKKSKEWSSIAKDNDVSVRFYVQKQSISILGARLHVQKAKSSFMELASALFTDTLTVDKPGAKKYFQNQGKMLLSTLMNELRCAVFLRPEIEDDEEEEAENYEEETTLCYCKVQTNSGVLISVSKVDICSFGVDAVVNAANEDLDHIGGLALALLKAAGPQLQRESSDYVAKNGRLRPGDAIITDAYNLPCKHVVHAVGPRFSDFDRKTAVSRLKTAVRESLRQAEMANCSSIALPAISSGIFGFPVDLCAETIAQAVREYCDSPQGLRSLTEIHLVDNNDRTVRVMATAVSKEFSDLRPTMTIPQQAGGKRTGASGLTASAKIPSSILVVLQLMHLYLLSDGRQEGVQAMRRVVGVSDDEDSSAYTSLFVDLLQRRERGTNNPGSLNNPIELSLLIGLAAAKPRCKTLCQNVFNGASAKWFKVKFGESCFSDSTKGVETFVLFYICCGINGEGQLNLECLLCFCLSGQGGVSPSTVADAMVDAVMEFVEKKQPSFVQSVRILIFQTTMLTEFHTRMEKRQGEVVEEKTVNKNKIIVFKSPLLTYICLMLQAASQAKKMIIEQIRTEQAQKTISDPCISQLSQADMEKLKALQRELTVSIRLDKGTEDQDPEIHLEGLTRDVYTAEDIIRKVERAEALMKKALEMSELVEWRFKDHNGSMVAFDMNTNLTLEEAFKTKQKAKIKINNDAYTADPEREKAVSANGRNDVELHRKDLKGQLLYFDENHQHDVFGLRRQIERVQNPSLWQNYQIMKKQMEVKNKHTNNELLLFHGTTDTSIDLINKQGFNRSYAGKNGAMYGNGSYFAVDPTYSAGNYATPDTSGHKRMYQARVLVGDYTQGRKGMITPPPKSGSASDLYDSVTNDTANPIMFVVFNDIQAYPEYLITFT
uniref:Poly [ADP-ribose] polymerase n=1 Tax=Pundamilia nyererei TaxID=303518 RepID=A0A3B4FEP5_9CICH